MRGNEYFAGLFDGEGTVGVYVITNSKKSESGKKNYWMAKMSIVGTYRPQIEAAYNHFKVGSLSTQKRQALQKLPKGKTIDPKLCRQGWRWSVQAKKDVAEVIEKILPYLMEKKEQAEIVLKFCKGELDGEMASRLCKEAKRFEYSADLGESPRKSTGSCSEHNPLAKLTYEQAQEIRQRVHNGEKQIKIARELGVSKTQISRIVNNITYVYPPMSYNKGEKPIPDVLPPPEKTAGSGRAKLTYEQAQEIRLRVKRGERQFMIAHELGITRTQVSKIVNNQTYVSPNFEIIEPPDKGGVNIAAKLTYEEADIVRQRVKNGEKVKDLAMELNMTTTAIYNLINSRTYIRKG